MNLFVGNLPFNVTEDELRESFAAYGEVASVSLVTDRFSGQSKGFAFVEMPSNAEADTAIKGMKEAMLGGRRIKVNQAKPKAKRSSPRRR